jgi:hypothetical protein
MFYMDTSFYWPPLCLIDRWISCIYVNKRKLKTPRHENIWGSEDIAPRILKLGCRGRWVVNFTVWPLYPQKISRCIACWMDWVVNFTVWPLYPQKISHCIACWTDATAGPFKPIILDVCPICCVDCLIHFPFGKRIHRWYLYNIKRPTLNSSNYLSSHQAYVVIMSLNYKRFILYKKAVMVCIIQSVNYLIS